jgi:hypothetical protein
MSININAEMELMAIEISQNCFSGEYAISIPPEIPLAFQGIGMRSANRSLVAKIHASCIIGCLATLMPCGEGRVGWACGTPDWGQLSAPQWVWERYGESVPLLLISRTNCSKKNPAGVDEARGYRFGRY